MPESIGVVVGDVQDLTPYEELQATKTGEMRCRFVDHYVLDPTSATQAVINAGYKVTKRKSATRRAYVLMHDPLVAAAIAQKMQERQERTKVTQDRVLHELAIIAFSNLDYFDINPETGQVTLRDGVPEYAMRAVSKVKFTVKTDEEGRVTKTTEFALWSKTDMLKALMKHLGMINDVQVNGDVHVHTQKWVVGGQEIAF